ncbi:MAG TPA: RNA polymerase sigma factor [Bryobacteraceae bacterium]|nr:RNA polymerase sigma factor [Bryobacteraceae bacterium]
MQIRPIVEPPLKEVSLERLLEGYQQADALATTELICRLSPDLLRFFLAQETTRTEAEDMLQNTWLRIHKVRHTYRTGAPVLPWVFAIAKHVRVDAYRKRRRIQQYEIATETLPDGAPPREPAGAEIPTFESLIAGLPQSQREVLTMLKVNGLSLDEVARATASSVGAVKQKASRAYAKLRTLLSRSEQWASGGKEATGAR